jgi:hypothetical protein
MYQPLNIQDELGLTLTESAIRQVKLLLARDKKEGHGLRVGVTDGGCSGSLTSSTSTRSKNRKTPCENGTELKSTSIPRARPFSKVRYRFRRRASTAAASIQQLTPPAPAVAALFFRLNAATTGSRLV